MNIFKRIVNKIKVFYLNVVYNIKCCGQQSK